MREAFLGMAIIAFFFLLHMTFHKIRHGSACCGEMQATEIRIKVRDKNKGHYPYVYQAKIEGMVCANCARRVENALNRLEGIWAVVDLANKSVLVRSKKLLDKSEVIDCLQGTSYILTDFTELNEGQADAAH